MNNEEKMLAILMQMQGDITGLKTDVSSLKADVSSLKLDVSGIKVRLDVDIQTQIDRLVDGQDSLDRRLSHVEELAEGTKDKVDVIHAVVAQHSRDIHALKKA